MRRSKRRRRRGSQRRLDEVLVWVVGPEPGLDASRLLGRQALGPVARNDGVAFAALQRRVARWAERQLTSAALRIHRDDVIADTCTRVILGIGAAHGAETFQQFAYGHYLNARRRALRSLREPVVALGEMDLPEPAESRPAADDLAVVERCLAKLPTRERRAVELRYLEDASTKQIAEALSVSEANARRIVCTGLAKLRRTANPLGRPTRNVFRLR